jgi:hypothetical protein
MKEEKSLRCRKPRLAAVGIYYADHETSSIRKFFSNFSYKLWQLGQYNSIADLKPRSFASFKVVSDLGPVI